MAEIFLGGAGVDDFYPVPEREKKSGAVADVFYPVPERNKKIWNRSRVRKKNLEP